MFVYWNQNFAILVYFAINYADNVCLFCVSDENVFFIFIIAKKKKYLMMNVLFD